MRYWLYYTIIYYIIIKLCEVDTFFIRKNVLDLLKICHILSIITSFPKYAYAYATTVQCSGTHFWSGAPFQLMRTTLLCFYGPWQYKWVTSRQWGGDTKKSRIQETLNISTDTDRKTIAMERKNLIGRSIIFLRFFRGSNIFFVRGAHFF